MNSNWSSEASSFKPQFRLASAINGISHLTEVKAPYIISNWVKVGDSPRIQDAGF